MNTQSLPQYSAIYTGTVSHRRLHPRVHAFEYKVFMLYLDLDELDSVFKGSLFWSTKLPALAWFRRADYLNPAEPSLEKAVRLCISEATGETINGPIRLLTNLRYFGFIMNPISCYYCYDEQEQLRYIIAEVTNTPWKERVPYVIPCQANKSKQQHGFDKQMHVSPFMPMDCRYEWRSHTPNENLFVHLENFHSGEKIFAATMSLNRLEINPKRLDTLLLCRPLMTAKVGLAIYWQALKLFLKKIPLFNHSNTASSKP